MKTGLAMLAGLGLGVALTYLVDAMRGNERRSTLASGCGSAGFQAIRRALRPNALGISLFRSCPGGKVLSDALLGQEVRTVVDEAITRPHGIETLIDDGQVTLQGTIREEEIDSLLNKVSRIPGVRTIANRLVVLEPMENSTG